MARIQQKEAAAEARSAQRLAAAQALLAQKEAQRQEAEMQRQAVVRPQPADNGPANVPFVYSSDVNIKPGRNGVVKHACRCVAVP